MASDVSPVASSRLMSDSSATSNWLSHSNNSDTFPLNLTFHISSATEHFEVDHVLRLPVNYLLVDQVMILVALLVPLPAHFSAARNFRSPP